MAHRFEQATLADAVGRLRAGMKVLVAPGSGDPSALTVEILRQADRLAPLTLMGGLRLDDFAFASAAYAGKIRFATWHMSPRLAAAEARGDVDFVPARYFDTVSLFCSGGAWAPDAVLVHTAPPDRGGYLSLGVSVSYLLPAARRAPLVIAQVNPRMPRTLGNAFLHRSQVDAWTPVDHPLHCHSAEFRRCVAGLRGELACVDPFQTAQSEDEPLASGVLRCQLFGLRDWGLAAENAVDVRRGAAVVGLAAATNIARGPGAGPRRGLGRGRPRRGGAG